MEIFSACPFSVSTLTWEPAAGRRSLCVSVKATFTLVPGGVATIAPLQEPLSVDARDGDAELAPFKPRADVLLVGHAHAPRGATAETLIARARVGSFRKSLSITGDRSWVPSFDGLRPSAAVPFRRMPLSYDRAVRAGENAGGIDIIAQGAEIGRALPNIAAIADQGGETPGFGPIPIAWRARRYGLADAAIVWASRVALASGPPPAGFDFRMFNAASAEQQLDEIPAGVEIALENLHPEHPWVETRLPALRVKVFRRAPRADRATETHARCDTLSIDTDRGLCSVIWRGAVPIEGADETSVGRLVIAAELDGERIGPEHADRLLAQLAPQVTYVEAGPAFGLAPSAGAPVPARSTPPAATSYPPPAAISPPRARPITQPPVAPSARPPSEHPRPKTLIPMAAPTVAGALPFRAPPTGFEAVPALASRESYPPPPPPARALSPRPPPPGTMPPAPPVAPAIDPSLAGRVALEPPPPVRAAATPTPPMMPAPVPPPSWAPPAEEEEMTPPRGYMAIGERTAMGTIVPPASTPPPTVPRPAPSEPERVAPRPPPVEPERTASGTIRPPPAELATGSYPALRTPAFGGRPTPTPPAAMMTSAVLPFTAPPIVAEPPLEVAGPPAPPPLAPPPLAPPPLAPPPLAPPSLAQPPVTPVAPPNDSGVGLRGWCAVKVEAWAGAAPMEEVLRRHGIDEAAFRAFEEEQATAIAREAAEGRSDRAIAVVEALHAARAAV